MPRLAVYCLGPLQLMLDDRPVTSFTYNKARTLLAFLAMDAGRPQYRTRLAGFFWPELPEEAARSNLRQALADLRDALGDPTGTPPFLLVSRETVQLNPDSECYLDVREFSALLDECQAHAHRHIERCRACAARMEQAAALYRGDFLSQFILRNDAPFEDWALMLQEGLRQRMLNALFHVCNYHERRAAHELVIRHARRQLEIDPAREEAHRALMRTYARSGQRSAALAQYEACRSALSRELDVAPAQETLALYQRIRDHWESEMAFTPTGVTRLLTDLPAPPSALIGRERELAELGGRLTDPSCRIMTVAGLGGAGKTRLALAAAAGCAYLFEHGVIFVDLSAINSADLVAPAMLAALRVPVDQQQEPPSQLLHYLADKELLLVLDNFEQVMPAAGLVARITQRAPRVTVLVTSRERLALRAEWVFDLGGLSYPAGEPPGQIEGYEAVQLFCERARQSWPQFTLSANEARAVAQICQLVEGLPLAIELAASGARRRTCAAIAADISRNLRSLSAELRDMPVRQRSMWATLEYSWHMLDEEERSILARLAVFRDGFQTEAAAAAAGSTESTLSGLADKSLVRYTAAQRYEMHELIRQYAWVKLQQAGESAQTQNRHLEFYVSLAESAEPQLLREAQVTWLKQLLSELGNLRSALAWSQEDPERHELGLRLAGALWHFWDMSGLLSEGRDWLSAALARADGSPTAAHAHALNEAGRLALFQGDFKNAQRLLREGLNLSRRMGDQKGEATAWFGLGWAAFRQGKYWRGEVLYAASAETFKRLEDEWGAATVFNSWGLLANAQGDPQRAIGLHEQALTLRRALRDGWGMARSLKHLGDVWLTRDELSRAQSLYDQSLALFQELGDLSGTSAVWKGLGLVAARQGNYARASALLQDTLKLNEELGIRGAVAGALTDLGDVACMQRDYPRALEFYRRALASAQELQTGWDMIWCLQGFAAVAAACGQPQSAVSILAATEAMVAPNVLRARVGSRQKHEEKLKSLQSQLDATTFAALRSEGHAMSLADAVAKALRVQPVHALKG